MVPGRWVDYSIVGGSRNIHMPRIRILQKVNCIFSCNKLVVCSQDVHDKRPGTPRRSLRVIQSTRTLLINGSPQTRFVALCQVQATTRRAERVDDGAAAASG